MTPISKLADGIFAAVAGFVARRLEPLAADVAELKKREPPKDGKSIDAEEVRAMLAELVAAAVKQIRVPQDGKDFDPQLMLQAVAEAVGKIEKPKDGTSVHPDTVARMVHEEVEKAAAKIKVPKDGLDAAQIKPLHAIDQTRSYPSGTWALHAGGMVCSFRGTDAGDVSEKNGWNVVLNGIAEETMDVAEDLRTIGMARRYTDGTVIVKTLKFPVMIDRGLFAYDRQYEAGDVVTWAGALWISRTATIGVEPRNSDGDWRLAVKRGRDGKDLTPKDMNPAPPPTVRL